VCILQAWAGFETKKKAGGWGNIPGFKGLPAQDTQSIGLSATPFPLLPKKMHSLEGQKCLKKNKSPLYGSVCGMGERGIWVGVQGFY
jgi:hypothetical protein